MRGRARGTGGQVCSGPDVRRVARVGEGLDLLRERDHVRRGLRDREGDVGGAVECLSEREVAAFVPAARRAVERVPRRPEGGMYTGKGRDDDSCEAGVPAGVNIANRRFVVDEVTGSVVAFCTFGAGGPASSGAPDTHLFRVENGKLSYVHTLTHLLQSSFRGNAAPQGNRPPGVDGPGQPAAPAQPAR